MSAGYRVLSLAIVFVFVSLSSVAQQMQMSPSGQGASQAAKKLEGVGQSRFLSKRDRGEVNGLSSSSVRELLKQRSANRAEMYAKRAGTASVSLPAEGLPGIVPPGMAFREASPGGLIPDSVATGDFNRDGHMDYVVANGWTDDLWMYFGKGDGTFALPRIIPLTQGISPVVVVAASLRGNDVLDLIVGNFDTSSIGILQNNGDGTFGYESLYSLPQPPASLVADDFNGDGKLDVVVVLYSEDPPSPVPHIATFYGDGHGILAAPIITYNWGFYTTIWNVVSGDVNSDKLPDLLLTGPELLDNSVVYINKGDGTFQKGQQVASNGPFDILLDARFGDFNEDGCLDTAVADANTIVWVSPGSCDGSFGPSQIVRMGDANGAIRLADMNGDGHLDLVTSAIGIPQQGLGDVAADMVSVALGDGHGGFANGRNYRGLTSYALALADFNEDARPDVVTANSDDDSTMVYINDRFSGFGFPEGLNLAGSGSLALNTPISTASFGDLNNDGNVDVSLIVTGNNDSRYALAAVLGEGNGRFRAPITSPISLPSGSYFGGYRFADFRNTGHIDFVAVGQDTAYSMGTNEIFFSAGRGDGSFGTLSVAPLDGASGQITVGDFNRDGKLDVVAVGGVPKRLTFFAGNGDGTFIGGVPMSFVSGGYDTARVWSGDFNRDNKLDVLVYVTGNGDWTADSGALEFLGNGDGIFQTPRTLFSPFQRFEVADLNGDHFPDLLQYDSMWPDSNTTIIGPARTTTYLSQTDGSFVKGNSYAPYAGVPMRLGPYLQTGDPAATSFLSDFNGDGILDSLSFQSVLPYSSPTYAQFLLGLGDGTFLPTFDIFDFHKNTTWPRYAHDLDGDGRAELLELDTMQYSMHVIKTIPAPAIQLALEDEVVSSGGCGYVFPNLPSEGMTVQLSSSVAGVELPASVTLGAGSMSQRFCYTLGEGFDRRQVFDIRAQTGSDAAVAYASATYVEGFSEAIAPAAEQVIYPTQDAKPITVTLLAEPGYPTTVTLSCSPLAQVSCEFGSNTLELVPGVPSFTTLLVHTTSQSKGGTIFIIATDGKVSRRQGFILRLQELIVSSSDFVVNAGATGETNVFVWGLPPYAPSCSGLPVGVGCSFAGAELPYPSTTNYILTATVADTVAAGTYPFTVTVTSQGIVRSTGVTLRVRPKQDFTIEPPTGIFAVPGGTVRRQVHVVGNETIWADVDFTCMTDWGSSCNSTRLTVFPGTSVMWVDVTAAAGMAPGQHKLTIAGSGAGITRSIEVPFYIADYSGTASSHQLTMAAGASSSVTITMDGTTGFYNDIQFSCTGPTSLTCTFNPAVLSLVGGTPRSATVTVSSSSLAHARPIGSRATFAMALLSLLCCPFLYATGSKWSRRARLWTATSLVLATAMVWISCGGGGGGSSTPVTPVTPPKPPTSYSITLTASAVGTSTTRQVATIDVTVTH